MPAVLNHPHDKFFKAVFSQPDVVRSLIHDLFPDQLIRDLNLDSLVLSNDSYIDSELSEHFADLVYSCTSTIGVPFSIALLLEHKCYPTPDVHLQLLRYITNRWQEDVTYQRRWTPVVPVVIYHGAKPWLYQSLEANLSGITDSLRPYLPSFDYLLVDLSTLSEEQIVTFRNSFLRVSAGLLKYRHNKKHYERFIKERMAALLSELDLANRRIIEPIIVYLVETTDFSGSDFVAIFSTASKQTQTYAMTTADRLREEGRIEGRTAERQELTQRYVKGMLRISMSAESIAAVLEMSLTEVAGLIKRIQQEG